jgi:hypothetical protein
MGEVQAYFPSLPATVVVFKPERPPATLATGIVVPKALPRQPGRPLPGWEPRWAFLRDLASGR